MADTYLRPAAASRRYGVSERTLSRWAAAGLIGRSAVDGIVLYPSHDIAELIASKLAPRRVVPIAATPADEPTPGDAWRDSDFWAGTAAGRGAER